MRITNYVAAGAVLTGLAVATPARADSWTDGVFANLLASALGLQSNSIIRQANLWNVPVAEVAPAYNIAHYTGQPVQTVWVLHRRGHPWYRIARELRVSESNYNHLQSLNAFDPTEYWNTRIVRTYGPSARTNMAKIRSNGGSWYDAFHATLLGRRVNQNPYTIYKVYRTNGSWGRVANTYGYRYSNGAAMRFVPAKPVVVRRPWHPAPPVRRPWRPAPPVRRVVVKPHFVTKPRGYVAPRPVVHTRVQNRPHSIVRTRTTIRPHQTIVRRTIVKKPVVKKPMFYDKKHHRWHH